MKSDPDRDFYRWLGTADAAIGCGWLLHEGWIFKSPSGTLHDLSAADSRQLDRIEREGHFLVEADNANI